MGFEDILGQREVIDGLMHSIKNKKIGHAYIFSGPAGIGKKTVAREFARLLLCSTRPHEQPCGQCMSCKLFLNGANPDFHQIEAAGAAIGVDEIRAIQGDIIVKPLYSPYKVYLIAGAEKMTAQAQNCLLKTLEEPPGSAVLILTASNTDGLMETVKSRAVKVAFKRNTQEEVRRVLNSKPGNGNKDLGFIASYADGIIGTALDLLESEEFFSLREKTVELTEQLGHSKLLDVFTAYGFFEANKGSVDVLLDTMFLLYRDMLVCKRTGKENILINSDKKDIILRNVDKISVRKLIKNIDVIEATRRNIKQNANFQLSVEVMLMKLQEEPV